MSAQLEEIWSELGPGAIFLSPLGALYGLGWVAYKSVYDLGFKKAARPHIPVICVGSMIAGGAGKTPVTLCIHDHLQALGRQVVIGMSGYRSERRKPAYLAPTGELDANIWGDETALMRWMRPDTPLVVGKDRVKAAEIAHEAFPNHFLLMDDGFQHLPIHKDISIVLDPPNLTNRLPIPAGSYREFWSLGKKRADMILPNQNHYLASNPLRLLENGLEPARPPAETQVLCAIARPWRLYHSLEEAGVKIGKSRYLADHANLGGGGLLDGFDQDQPIVTTAKDWVKLKHRTDLSGWTFLVAMHEVTIEPAHTFRTWLADRLNSLAP